MEKLFPLLRSAKSNWLSWELYRNANLHFFIVRGAHKKIKLKICQKFVSGAAYDAICCTWRLRFSIWWSDLFTKRHKLVPNITVAWHMQNRKRKLILTRYRYSKKNTYCRVSLSYPHPCIIKTNQRWIFMRGGGQSDQRVRSLFLSHKLRKQKKNKLEINFS